MYILTSVNEQGYTNGQVFASINLDHVLDVMRGAIIRKYQDDPQLIEGLLDQFYTIDARAEVRRILEENRYYSLSGPDETPFEISSQENELRILNFFRQAEPRNMGNNNANNFNENNANNFNENENRNQRQINMNYQHWANVNLMNMRGGKHKMRKTRKAKKSKKSKKTRRY